MIYNSIRTNTNKKNKFASKLEEKFNSEIKLLRSEINSIDFNIHSKYNGGLRKKVQSFVNAGSMPDLEELFSKYEEEENKLILNKLQK